ncbi:hypothetical protein RRG08_042476, partial [Elysia crispata]
GESFRIWSRPGPVGYLAEPVPSTGPSAFPEIDVTKLEVADPKFYSSTKNPDHKGVSVPILGFYLCTGVVPGCCDGTGRLLAHSDGSWVGGRADLVPVVSRSYGLVLRHAWCEGASSEKITKVYIKIIAAPIRAKANCFEIKSFVRGR